MKALDMERGVAGKDNWSTHPKTQKQMVCNSKWSNLEASSFYLVGLSYIKLSNRGKASILLLLEGILMQTTQIKWKCKQLQTHSKLWCGQAPNLCFGQQDSGWQTIYLVNAPHSNEQSMCYWDNLKTRLSIKVVDLWKRQFCCLSIGKVSRKCFIS